MSSLSVLWRSMHSQLLKAMEAMKIKEASSKGGTRSIMKDGNLLS